MIAVILWFCVFCLAYGLWFDAFMERQRDRGEARQNARLAAETAARLAYWKDEQHADALRMDAARAATALRVDATRRAWALHEQEQHANALRMDAARAACGFCYGTGRLADDIPCPACAR